MRIIAGMRYEGGITFLADEGQRPGKHVHEVREPVRMRSAVCHMSDHMIGYELGERTAY